MRSSYVAVLVAVLAMVGCDTLKSFMPGPTANKAINVPANAVRVALDTADGISFAPNKPGEYYFVENDTRNVVLFYTVQMGENSRDAFTPRRLGQLDTKRKYEVFYVPDPATTQPAVKTATASPATPANPLTSPSTMPVM